MPLHSLLRRAFPFLHWPLMSYPGYVDQTEPSEGLDRHLSFARHSLRLQRYWWAARAIEDEARANPERTITVVDLGCERGWMKRFVSPMPNIRWIGLDGNLSHPSLAASRYDETIEANFAEPLPLPDACADVVVSLHVFEHLPDPELAGREVSRLLKPGGLFLVGTPVGPEPLASIRTRVLRAKQRNGTGRHWGHLQKFSPGAWGTLCQRAGLAIQFMTGSHLFRVRGFGLENRAWWVRLNQLWGAIVPSLGQELYIAARKVSDPRAATTSLVSRLWMRADWAVAAAVLGLIGWMGALSLSPDRLHPLADEIAIHQDGDDVFRWCALAADELHDASAEGNVQALARAEALQPIFTSYRQRGFDLHIVVRAEDVARYQNSAGLPLYVADEWQNDGQRFVVLSEEQHHVHLSEWLQKLNAGSHQNQGT